jgi:hypothetical protein
LVVHVLHYFAESVALFGRGLVVKVKRGEEPVGLRVYQVAYHGDVQPIQFDLAVVTALDVGNVCGEAGSVGGSSVVLTRAGKGGTLALKQAHSFDFEILDGLLIRFLSTEDAEHTEEWYCSQYSDCSAHKENLQRQEGFAGDYSDSCDSSRGQELRLAAGPEWVSTRLYLPTCVQPLKFEKVMRIQPRYCLRNLGGDRSFEATAGRTKKGL